MDDISTIAVFDVGKTSCKVVLLDGNSLEIIAERRHVNAILGGPPYPHIDVENQWDFLCRSLAELERKHVVDAISITTHGATAAVVDDGELALPIMDYEYGIPAPAMDAYRNIRPKFVETFSPELPVGLNLGAQLFFQKEQFPEAFTGSAKILTFPQYWCWRMTGISRLERTSLGTHTDLWNPQKRDYSALVGRQFPVKLFPKLAGAREAFPVSGTAAQQLGVKAGIPVACGIHDSNASLLPWLELEQPLSVVSSGTWTIVMSVGGDLSNLDPSRDMLANVDASGAPVPTSRFMGGREYEILTDGSDGECSEIAIRNAVSDGKFALPGWVPGVGPFPNGPARWIPAPSNEERTKIAVATLYLAMMTATCLELVGTGDLVIVEGPFAKNEQYAAILSTLLKTPVHLSLDATGTSKGAAMLIRKFAPPELEKAIEPAEIDGLNEYYETWKSLSRAEA